MRFFPLSFFPELFVFSVPSQLKQNTPLRACSLLAGRGGFGPATGLTQHSLSRRAHSATLAPPRVFSLKVSS